ncbi:MAG: helix-turn-helix domain-containing protein [Oscillospiraceae bacterium]|nr:helix-turn-helix domain-containing protein [Oscillospiraceae bacterium]
MNQINYIGNTFYMDEDVLIRRVSQTRPVLPHTHDFMEFVYILGGKSLHTVNGAEYPMDRGDLLIVNYDEVHGFTAPPETTYYNILIKPTVIDKNLEQCRDLFVLFEAGPFQSFKTLVNDGCRCIRFSPEERDCFEYMLRLLETELERKDVGYELTAQAGVNFLLTMIFRKMRSSLPEHPNQFKEILTYIDDHCVETLSAAELAGFCHYSPPYFSRVFRKYTGLTFSEYVKRVRIGKACAKIREGRSGADLHTQAGYTNKTTFYKHFRQVTGMTPLEYRKAKK